MGMDFKNATGEDNRMNIHHRPLRVMKTSWIRQYAEELVVLAWMVCTLLAGAMIWLSVDRIERFFR